MVMIMSDIYSKLGLYAHNEKSYKKIKKAFDDGEKVVGIVHATGTGKTYNALQLAYDNRDKKITYIVPSNGIIEYIKDTIDANPNLDYERDFPNLEFKTYTSLVNLSNDEIKSLDTEILIIDEFHHIGAPVWGDRINRIINTHPDIKVFGMSAYTVRDRGTAYERDMANPETEELFSNKIVSRYDLYDAMMDGVLPIQISYRSVHLFADLEENVSLLEKLENKIDSLSETENKQYKDLLKDCKKRINTAKGIRDVVRKNIKEDAKIIYFCPPGAEEGINDIETIMEEVKGWYNDSLSEDDMVFYLTTSKMGEEGKLNREAFYKDETLDGKSAVGKLRIMFAINQYNEGIHAPNVDGVIMGRSTSSDIVYFEQLGRALSVSSRDGEVKSPVIIDLTNNYEFIKEIENNLKCRIKQRRANKTYDSISESKLLDASFDIEIENEDLYETLRYLKERLIPTTWEEMYSLAKNYYDEYGDLEVPISFRTKNGITQDNDGKNLGIWVRTQRDFDKKGCLLEERKRLLELIDMRFEANKYDKTWQEMYVLAQKYYDEHQNLEVPTRFRTVNGYDYDLKGKALGNWIRTQRELFKEGHLSDDRKTLLDNIGMRFGLSLSEVRWHEMYKLAQVYYKVHQDLEVPARFKTINGYEEDENGKNLGNWIKSQRELANEGKLSTEHKQLLDQIGIRYEIKDYDKNWKEMYDLAKAYYDEYGHLNISQQFKTNDGITYAEDGKNLGTWIVTQRKYYQENRMPEDKKQLLDAIQMRFEPKNFAQEWKEMYNLAVNYHSYYGNLEIPSRFVTKDGVTKDDEGKKLGKWIVNQRTEKRLGNLSREREELLKLIDMRFEPKIKTSNSTTFCDEYGSDKEKIRK